jgi:transcriptional regulator with XRE-family HTH domain
MNDLLQRLKDNFQDKDYRHIYTNGFIDSKIATQIKVLREQRVWTQDVLADETGMRQARVSVLEDVNYSSWSLSTLRRFARAFDLYVDVEFKEFGTLDRQLDELDREHLSRQPFSSDPVFHEAQLETVGKNVAEKISGADKPQVEQETENIFLLLASTKKPPISSSSQANNNFIPFPSNPPRIQGVERSEAYGTFGGHNG